MADRGAGKRRRGGWSWGPLTSGGPDGDGAKLRCLSVGAGVQSTALALMAARGVVRPLPVRRLCRLLCTASHKASEATPYPHGRLSRPGLPHAMIFADTQAESQATMAHLAWLEGEVTRLTCGGHWPPSLHGGAVACLGRMAVHRVTAGSITQTIEHRARGDAGRFVSAPFFTANGGMGRRQCTREYKVEPLTKKQRELLGYAPRQRIPIGSCEVWIGISTDVGKQSDAVPNRRPEAAEVVRAGSAFDRWVVHYGGFAAFLVRRRFACLHPLLEERMSRHDCQRWLEKHGYPVPPKSACIFCPYKSDAEWRWLRDNDADAWVCPAWALDWR